MNTIAKYLVLVLISFYSANVMAQDTTESEKEKAQKIETLKETIKSNEKDALKAEVEKINERVTKKEITYEEGETLKQEAAKKRALNIEDRIAILDKRVAFNDRNELENDLEISNKKKKTFSIAFGDNDNNLIGLTVKNSKLNPKPVKYDFRTVSGLVVGLGINDAIPNGQGIGDSQFNFGGAIELGFQWKTRLLKNSNAVRLRYGVSFQWNKYDLKSDKYFVQNGNTTTIEQFPVNLRKGKFRTTNIVVPLYFEFGQSNRIEKKDRIRFYNKGFKFGIGGYAGLNIGAKQKLWYKQDGRRVKQQIKQNYNVTPFVYGVGAYVGFDDISLFAKYDLSETFKNNSLKQNNVSLGVRFDLE